LANARAAAVVYPGWEVWIYHGNDVPLPVLQVLGAQKHVALINLSKAPNVPLKNGMTWRFLVASDPSVDYFIVRDIDSRLGVRERFAVDEWMASGLPFHVMRDHPGHSKFPMSGGMWGGTRDAIPDMAMRLYRAELAWWASAVRVGNGYLGDMQWLTEEIWPIVQQKGVWQSDSFTCDGPWGRGHPFPTPRTGYEIVGSVVENGVARRSDEELLAESPIVPNCRVTQFAGENETKFRFMSARVELAMLQGKIDAEETRMQHAK
jgi:hypothetical protein